MSELKAGDRMMAIVSDGPDFTGWVSIGDDANRCRVHPDALHPLPPALSAEDAAVLEAAAVWVTKKGEFSPNALWPSESARLFEAVRARAAAPVEGEKVAAWKETVRDIFDRLHGGRESVFSGSYLAKELVAMIERNHADYFCGVRAGADVTPALSLHADGDDREAEAVDREDERERWKPLPETMTVAPDIAALRDNVVDAALAWRRAFPAKSETWWGFPATATLANVIDDLRAALAPKPAADPVQELRDAAAELLKCHESGGFIEPDQDVLDRLRAALAQGQP